jgi:uncharacterized protein (TIGR02996 family)
VDALLAAVYANPADDAPRAVYADALVEQGNPLGELIQLQLGTRKGSKKRAKELFQPTLWKDLHPTGLIYERVQETEIERGFPVRFNAPSPSDYSLWKAHAKHPGWSTTKVIWGNTEPAALDAMAAILRDARLPLLEELTWAQGPVLETVAKRELPFRRLHATNTGKLPRLDKLSRLEVLDWGGTTGRKDDVRSVLDAVDSLGVGQRIRELATFFCFETVRIADGFALLAGLPANVREVRVNEGLELALRRDGSLELTLDSDDVEPIAEQLAALPAKQISSLTLTFRKRGGYFTKKNRAPLAKTIRDATKHFKKRELILE